MYTDCIFDLYGTLVDIWTDEDKIELWEKLSESFGPYGAAKDPRQLKSDYQRYVKEEEARLQSLRIEDETYVPEIKLERIFARLLGLDPELRAEDAIVLAMGRTFRHLSINHIDLYPGVKEMLSHLQLSGKRVWLLSNAQRIFTEPELWMLKLTPYFDGIFLSSDYGCKKPDPHFYQILMKEKGIRTEEAIMVGNDGVCDIGGAKRVGLHTIYMKSATSPKEALPDADYVLTSVDMRRVQELLIGPVESAGVMGDL